MSTRPRAVIFDVDGTLCDTRSVIHHLVNDEGRRDFHRFHVESTGCPTYPHVASLTHALRDDIARIVVTARPATYYQHTLWWLLLNDVRFDHLFMRRINDYRADRIVKTEILRTIQTRYDVVYAIDDNPNVCALWADEGIPFTQVPGYCD